MARRAGLLLAVLAASGMTAVPAAHARQRATSWTASFTLHVVAGGPFSGSDYDGSVSGTATSELTASWTTPVTLRVGDPVRKSRVKPIIVAGGIFLDEQYHRPQHGTGVPVGAQPGPGTASFHGTAQWSGTRSDGEPYNCRYDVGGPGFAKLLEVRYDDRAALHPLRAVTIEPIFHLTNKLGGVFYDDFTATCDNPAYRPPVGVRPVGGLLTNRKGRQVAFSIPKLLAAARGRHNAGQAVTRTQPAGCSNCALPDFPLGGSETITATAKLVKRP